MATLDRVPPAKLAEWRKVGIRRRLEDDPLIAAKLAKSTSAPLLAPSVKKPPQPVGLSARGVRKGMLRTLKLDETGAPTGQQGSPQSHRSGGTRRHGRRGGADLLPQEKMALHQLPLLPQGGVHVPVMPVFAGAAQ